MYTIEYNVIWIAVRSRILLTHINILLVNYCGIRSVLPAREIWNYVLYNVMETREVGSGKKKHCVFRNCYAVGR